VSTTQLRAPATDRRTRDPRTGDTIAYTTLGSGAPLVLLHPIGLDRTWWEPHTAVLARDHQVIAVDLPGHGATARARPGSTLEDFARTVRSALDAESVNRAHVMGVSMGGMVAQHLALIEPDRVMSLILCSTTGGFEPDLRPVLRERGNLAAPSGMAAIAPSTLDRWFSPEGLTQEIGRRCHDTLLRQDPRSWTACWHAIAEHDVWSKLGRLSVPALVITGAQDTSTPPAAAKALATRIPGAKLAIVDGAPHLGVFEHPAPFLQTITEFLAVRRARDSSI